MEKWTRSNLEYILSCRFFVFFFFLMEEGHQQRQKYLGQQKSKWSPGWVPHWKSRPHKTNWSTTWWNSPRSAQLASGPDWMCQLFAHRGFLNAALGKEWGIMEKFLAASKKTQKFFAGMFPTAEEQRLPEQFNSGVQLYQRAKPDLWLCLYSSYYL